MAERSEIIETFLHAHGWGDGDRGPLADDASFRRYDRLIDGSRRAVLMDAPPPEEDVRPFARLARHLRSLGYSAPEIFAEDAPNGLLLLEDLGDDTYTRMLADKGDERALYTLAVDVLIDLHRRPGDETLPPSLVPTYDVPTLLNEAYLLTDWYMPAITGEPTAQETRDTYGEIWRPLFESIQNGPKTLVLRDFHVDNLIWLPERPATKGCGLLDFQDALAGHPAYDLMSLLEDARRDIADDLINEMLERYLSAFDDLDREAFMKAYTILGAGRHAKVIGIFTRLSVRDGKPQYLHHIPRVWKLLERAIHTGGLDSLGQWVDHYIPKNLRGIPSCPPTT
ncbi:MAG: phosphotransferase [Rhodospirillaceae bacterium]|nr:phosphotransferase [Rhodospirillales bacterium]MBT3907459.1 phosphotransferase [Rhodospirillaceae bacterium]MBT4700959.1 phosphotransferase [Rhodospirillaceae bacterium]MBT5033791.1 phosphotransferase [Rhodospirillaceae bacterium]MBT6220800.1 phosphotransferase [Rhodospirillaceae bacterium]